MFSFLLLLICIQTKCSHLSLPNCYLLLLVFSHGLFWPFVTTDELFCCFAWLLLVVSIFSVYDAGLGNSHPPFLSKNPKTNSKHKNQTTTKTPCLFHVCYAYHVLSCFAVQEETIWKHRHFLSLKLCMHSSVEAVKIRRFMLCVYTCMRLSQSLSSTFSCACSLTAVNCMSWL